jgi:glycosyltransferase involved in cell wall biosynthesis
MSELATGRNLMMSHGKDELAAIVTTTTTTTNENENKSENERTTTEKQPTMMEAPIYVDIIIPAHNASLTIDATIHSAFAAQTILPPLFDVVVCCYDDGSTDDTHDKLLCLQTTYNAHKLRVGTSTASRGAGYARNRAVALRDNSHGRDRDRHFLCLLDSDDTMHPNRIMEQVYHHMMALSPPQRHATILGCRFDRHPPDATWHYAQWANGLTDERIMLERYREVTILQPTWVLTRHRFHQLGGYVEAPDDDTFDVHSYQIFAPPNNQLRLVHTTFETRQTMRLAEDLRLLYAHLHDHGRLALHRGMPLVTYRHVPGMTQSSQTSRKLLLHLRVLALELAVLSQWKTGFVVWGAGRDGKDFVKALTPDMRSKICCFVDVDHKKIDAGYYANKDIGVKIPIVHYSHLIKDEALRTKIQESDQDPHFGRIQKGAVPPKSSQPPPMKRRKVLQQQASDLDMTTLPNLPVIVCVAMYRTGGALEANVASIGRTEGEDLWHLS